MTREWKPRKNDIGSKIAVDGKTYTVWSNAAWGNARWAHDDDQLAAGPVLVHLGSKNTPPRVATPYSSANWRPVKDRLDRLIKAGTAYAVIVGEARTFQGARQPFLDKVVWHIDESCPDAVDKTRADRPRVNTYDIVATFLGQQRFTGTLCTVC